MKVLFADEATVAELSSIREYIKALERMFKAVTRGDAVLPARLVLALPSGAGSFFSMPGHVGTPGVLGAKLLTFFPRNVALPSHQGVILLFDPDNGRFLAALEAGTITELRTAAASAIATRLLSRRDSDSLAILGSGKQAWSHLRALLEVREFRSVKVWSRDGSHAESFLRRARSTYRALSVAKAESPREAVRGVDVVCTTTATSKPILRGSWVGKGTHVNAIGYANSDSREIDSELVRKSRLYTDRRESLLSEAGDFKEAKKKGLVGDSHLVGDLGELLLSRVKGRVSDDDVTLYRGLGIATEDLAVAEMVYRKAASREKGKWLELERAPEG